MKFFLLFCILIKTVVASCLTNGNKCNLKPLGANFSNSNRIVLPDFQISTTFTKNPRLSVSFKSITEKTDELISMQRTVYSLKMTAGDLTTASIYHSICDYWNATVGIQENSHDASITVQFSPMPAYLQCFNFYDIYLYILQTRECNFENNNAYRIQTSDGIKLENKQGIASFNNLSSGNYCALVVPIPEDQDYEPWSLNSNVVEIHVIKEVWKSAVEHRKFPAEVIIAATLVLCICGLGVLFYYKQKHGSKVDIELDTKILAEETIPLTSGKILVYIFHVWTDDNIREYVAWLKDFLEACTHFVVISMQELQHRITDDECRWAKDIFDYKCFNRGDSDNSNVKFLFINSKNSGPITNFKDRAFFNLVNSPVEKQKIDMDYCHVFVASFGNRPQGVRYPSTTRPTPHQKTCIPDDLVFNSRYVIPNELVDLCLLLGCSPTEKQDLEERLRTHRIWTHWQT